MSVKVFVVGFSVLMAAGGLYLVNLSKTAPATMPGLVVGEPRHPVTDAMMRDAARMNKKMAPFVELPSADGPIVKVGGKGPRPQFVYFVKEGCPCSYDAEPIFHDLAKHYKGKIDFISITDSKKEKAKQWQFDMRVDYPVVYDPTLATMKKYEVAYSVINMLVDKDGVIVKKWAGYSKDLLAEMNKTMAETLGEKVRPFDPTYAPVRRTTGCGFEFAD